MAEACVLRKRGPARALAMAIGLGAMGWAAIAGAGAARAEAETYTFDKQHTEVRFSWNHLGLSRQSGRFLDVGGSLDFDREHPEQSRVEVVIRVPSLSTGVKELDSVLKGREFFDVAANPIATFRSTSVERKGDRSAAITGDLTINGITKPVVLDAVLNFTGEHPLSKINPVYEGLYYAGFSARTQIRRSDWGLTRTIPYVSDEIRITIEAELKRTSAPVAPVEQAPIDGTSPAPAGGSEANAPSNPRPDSGAATTAPGGLGTSGPGGPVGGASGAGGATAPERY